MKRYILRKYVNANNISDAIKQDKATEVADAWIDEKESQSLTSAIGFHYEAKED